MISTFIIVVAGAGFEPTASGYECHFKYLYCNVYSVFPTIFPTVIFVKVQNNSALLVYLY